MTRFATIWLIFAAVAIAVILWLAGSPWAQEATDRGAWFKSLTIPGNGGSCCSEADCKKTPARFKNGTWWALVTFDNTSKWLEVPRDRILKEPKSLDGFAYTCHSGGSATAKPIYVPGSGAGGMQPPYDPMIFCFVPPGPEA